MKSFDVSIKPNVKVPVVKLPPSADLNGIQTALKLPEKKGSIAVVGGAAGFDKPEFRQVKDTVGLLLVEMADLAHKYNIAVVDGGTPAGYMKILGETRAIRRHDFDLIGVAPLGRIKWYGRSMTWTDRLHHMLIWLDFDPGPIEEKVLLDAEHTCFVLVETNEWGGEVNTLAGLANELANGQGTVEVLINGGMIARQDVTSYLEFNPDGQLIVIEGTGRFADELAAAFHRGSSNDTLIQKVLNTQRVHIFPLESSPGEFRKLLLQLGKWA